MKSIFCVVALFLIFTPLKGFSQDKQPSGKYIFKKSDEQTIYEFVLIFGANGQGIHQTTIIAIGKYKVEHTATMTWKVAKATIQFNVQAGTCVYKQIGEIPPLDYCTLTSQYPKPKVFKYASYTYVNRKSFWLGTDEYKLVE